VQWAKALWRNEFVYNSLYLLYNFLHGFCDRAKMYGT
jgi:hypothetical protein